MPRRAKPEIMDYDPNIRWAKQKVKITLGRWKYRASWTVEIGGNCKGFNIFDSALDALNDIFIKERDESDNELLEFTLETADGSMLVEGDGDEDYDWLHPYVIAMEIVDIQKETP